MRGPGKIALAEEWGPVFASEFVVPVQFFPSPRRRIALTGEYRLLVGILEDAIDIYLKGGFGRGPRQRAIFRETRVWIESTRSDWVFSFERICVALDLDPHLVRRSLQARRRWASRSSTLPEEGPESVSTEGLSVGPGKGHGMAIVRDLGAGSWGTPD